MPAIGAAFLRHLRSLSPKWRQDQARFGQVAENDKDYDKRLNALEFLEDQVILARIAENDDDY